MTVPLQKIKKATSTTRITSKRVKVVEKKKANRWKRLCQVLNQGEKKKEGKESERSLKKGTDYTGES